MFLANKKIDDQVKTYITYNKGRDWRLLQAPSTDLRGNSIHCVLVRRNEKKGMCECEHVSYEGGWVTKRNSKRERGRESE